MQATRRSTDRTDHDTDLEVMINPMTLDEFRESRPVNIMTPEQAIAPAH